MQTISEARAVAGRGLEGDRYFSGSGTYSNHPGNGRPEPARPLLRQGAAALSAAHEAGLIHRDIKPANLFLVNADGGFELKLLDFGIAKIVKGTDDNPTVTGAAMATPAYASPEQVPCLSHSL